MHSLQAKIVFVYLALASLIVGLSGVALVELNRIAAKAQEGSQVAELVDATLEMRRFEKNLLLYGDASNLREHARFVATARRLLERDAAIIDALRGPGAAANLQRELNHYAVAMQAQADAPGDERLAGAVRALGNQLVTAGEALAAAERTSLNAALTAHRRNLLWSLAVVAALLGGTGFLLARRVTRPLQAMETRMEAVASGQLTRLPVEHPERELAALAQAFNHVLDELERRQHTLLRAEKLASLGTLLSGVAHELNNPLSNISSSAQILKEDADQTDPCFHRQLVEDIDAETLRARRIVRSLLDYAGDRAFQPAEVPLAELAEETLRFLKSRRPAGIEIRLEIAPDLCVLGDRPRLQQMLLNLILNAYDAMDGMGRVGGELWLHAEARTLGQGQERDPTLPAVFGQCRPGSRVVELRVADTGPGLPAEHLERVFDPFFTTKPIGQGSGLGLFITHEILEEHGGCIRAANRPEGGAEFRLRLPAASCMPSKPAPRKETT